MIHMRFCWTNLGLKHFKMEVEEHCAKCCHEVKAVNVFHGFLGIRCLVIIQTEPCAKEETT